MAERATWLQHRLMRKKMNCSRSDCPSGWHRLDRPPFCWIYGKFKNEKFWGFFSIFFPVFSRKKVFSCFSLSRSLFVDHGALWLNQKAEFHRNVSVFWAIFCVCGCVWRTHSHVKWLFCGWASCLMYQDQSASAPLVTHSFVIFHIR